MNDILVTGAGGRVGTVLRAHWRASGRAVTLCDIRPLGDAAPNETIVIGDLLDPAFLERVLKGVRVVVHLAGNPWNHDLDAILGPNVEGVGQLYETARMQGVRRILFASSNHVVGMYHSGTRIDTHAPVNPDGYYGVSKVWGEALARMYWEKHGVESLCLRIGSSVPLPVSERHLSTWLSPRDLCGFIDAGIDVRALGFDIAFGISANTRAWWDNSTSRLGYRALDNAEDYAAAILANASPPANPLDALLQGGDYASEGFTDGAAAREGDR
ncbi:NAD-dependent epimerase/dehydratase family protein [Pararobbsia silviterrae]|uniref:NAD(P)-dependent oxidoreductase n=1 Tax=Pararobbsia silviterrae TaxID=1792498 RepID=A0A494X5Z1_9BURK|nr:NAD(P)-dependent oxidoreductase [Pararobbsia silviterrae]RKP45061.1 NAD(P)-dependent oxidoreductase [Pararobbsia silviterrae]